MQRLSVPRTCASGTPRWRVPAAMLEYELASLASTQYGLLALDQLTALGLSMDGIDRRVVSGRWRRVHHGVYAVGGAPTTYEQRVLAACLGIGVLTAASHRTAAVIHGLLAYKQPRVEVTTTRDRSPELRQVHVHRMADLAPRWITSVERVPCTTVARTLVDLGAVSRPATVEAALDRAKGQGLVTSRDVRHAMNTVARQGRRGVGTIRALLTAAWGAEPPAGVVEARMASLIRAAGLPVAVPEFIVLDAHGGFVAMVDFAYPERRLAIEVDGYESHAPRRAFGNDRARDRLLADADWLALHYTWTEVDARLPHVASEIARHYRRRAPGTVRRAPGSR